MYSHIMGRSREGRAGTEKGRWMVTPVTPERVERGRCREENEAEYIHVQWKGERMESEEGKE